MINPIILLRRNDNFEESEATAMAPFFPIIESRLDIKPNSLVIGRYSVLPFYKEQERDIIKAGSKLINSYYQHRYVADIMRWYPDLIGLTPKTWPRLEDADSDGPFIVKGSTNSRKFQWDTHMFAETRRQAAEIVVELQNDSLIGSQDIIVRQYVPLKTYSLAIHGLPITKEFRFFVLYGTIISGGFYWSSHVDDLPSVPDANDVPLDFLKAVVAKTQHNCPFYTIDVAQTQAGDWIVIELNDGQMSGLSENKPDTLYSNMYNQLRGS